MSTVVEWLNSCLKRVSHEVFKDVVKVSDVETKSMDDGQIVLISDINKVTLTFETSGGGKRTLKAIAKLEPKPGPGQQMAKQFDVFPTEILMYTGVLKSMEMLMSDFGDKDTIWPEYYHCADNKLLIQDLCEIGYRVVPTYKFLDVEHALLVMKSIGKFHALSIVMKERCILNFKDDRKPFFAQKTVFMESLVMKCLTDLVKAIRESWGAEWSSVPDRLLKYLDKPNDICYDVWNSSRGKWDVLNHGDFTMRNMLFHYPPGSSHPDGIKFVDFQMCHYSSLANDLVSLLYSSMIPSVREENMKLLLETYVDSLTSTAESYGFKGPLPTVDDVEDCMKSLRPLMLVMLLFSIPTFVMSGKQDLQKKTSEYMEKYKDCDNITEAQIKEGDESFFNYFMDDDITAYLKIDLQTFIDNKEF